MSPMTDKGNRWQTRIIGRGDVPTAEIIPNRHNWRRHPDRQRDALEGVLDSIGWIQDVIVNKRTGNLIDGHLRVELAAKRKEASVPVLYVDLDEAEEALILASLDPISAMAETDKQKLDALFREISSDDGRVQQMLGDTAEKQGLYHEQFTEQKVEIAHATLAEQFIIPPFTVLDTRQGYWQRRKKAWIDLGIKSELGRTKNPLFLDSVALAKKNRKMRGRPPHGARVTQNPDGTLHYELTNNGADSGTSVFDPVLCELAYRWFTPQGGAVLDPFAGGSVRGIVASVLGRHYTGVDLSEEQIIANRIQAERIVPDNQPTWIVGDSANISELARGEYDFILTCPPYYDLEVYSDDHRDLSTMDYDNFIRAYRTIIAQCVSMLKDNRFAMFVVGDIREHGGNGNYRLFPMETVRAFQDAGMALYNEAVLVNVVGSLSIRVKKQFSVARKLGKEHQNVLVFVKGEARKAAEECGEIEVAFPEGFDIAPDDISDSDN